MGRIQDIFIKSHNTREYSKQTEFEMSLQIINKTLGWRAIEFKKYLAPFFMQSNGKTFESIFLYLFIR